MALGVFFSPGTEGSPDCTDYRYLKDQRREKGGEGRKEKREEGREERKEKRETAFHSSISPSPSPHQSHSAAALLRCQHSALSAIRFDTTRDDTIPRESQRDGRLRWGAQMRN